MVATVTLYLTFTLILDLGIYLFFSKQLLVKQLWFYSFDGGDTFISYP